VRIDVRPADGRFETRTPMITSRHSFSYGPHYNPDNVSFGLLVAHNDEILQPGATFSAHAHRDVEIVSWPVGGALRHRDDHGGSGVVEPGMAQLTIAGSGVRHVEENAVDAPTRYIQMWIRSDAAGAPSYARASIDFATGHWTPVAAAVGAPLQLRHHQALLLVARPVAGAQLLTASASFVHLFVTRGHVRLDGTDLREGDAVRMTDATPVPLLAITDAEILSWVMNAEVWRP